MPFFQASPLLVAESAGGLPPDVRLRALAALGALAVLGIALILLVWLIGQAADRYRHGSETHRPKLPPTRLSDDDWARKPLVPGTEELEVEDRNRAS